MSELNRRDFLALAAVPMLLPQRGRGQSSAAPAGLQVCMHEASSEKFDFRAAMEGYAKAGVRLVEPNLLKVREFAQQEGGPAAAKRLLDKGYYAPTTYFPLLVPECLLIEPTETESKQTLDDFVNAMREIAQEAETDPVLVKSAPHTTPVRRLDEVRAARTLDLAWRPT